MKIAIMQPYFFPYLGYIQLINCVDRFILLDDVQFIRHGWIERNRVLNSSDGWQYIKAPLEKHSRDTLIKDVSIRNTENWKDKILAQLTCYKKKAPYYKEVIGLLNEAFKKEFKSISEVNKSMLILVCNYLDIKTPIDIFSTLNISLPSIDDAGDWAFEISKSLNADTYINPINGAELFDKNKFERAAIDLKFITSNLKPYNQKREAFESGLSILDVLLFNSKEEVIKMLNDYELS